MYLTFNDKLTRAMHKFRHRRHDDSDSEDSCSEQGHIIEETVNDGDSSLENIFKVNTKMTNSESVEESKYIYDDDFSYETEREEILSRRLRAWKAFKKFLGFIGPGFMVAVAYMDPGNYATDISGGAQFQYRLLFVILLSTIIAMYLQHLVIRLGSVTGRDMAESSRDNLPKYVNWFLWFLAESAILATDLAEVAGAAIGFKILFNVPMIAGVFITIADTFIIIAIYGRENGMKAIRFLEWSVTILLFAVVICFIVILTKIPSPNLRELFRGYAPSNTVVSSAGIYASAGILGATVMPHSLYLGSSQVIPRVREHDKRKGYNPKKLGESIEEYKPSYDAIRSTIRYSTLELMLALSTVALFVNSAILIVAGTTMFGLPDSIDADLFTLNDTLKQYLGKSVAILFFVALLLSGLSSSIICTIAGQVVGEGYLKWHTRPWIRRLITRVVAMIPCVVIVACVGDQEISSVLNWSQVVLTITLPFLTAQLVYVTSRTKYMTVKVKKYNKDGTYEAYEGQEDGIDCANNWVSIIFGTAVTIFLFLANAYLLAEIGITGGP